MSNEVIRVSYFSRYCRQAIVVTFDTMAEAQAYIDVNSAVQALPGLSVQVLARA